MDQRRQITVDGQPIIIDEQTTIRELRELAAPSDQHVLVAWDDETFMLLDPKVKIPDNEDDKIVEKTDGLDEFTFEPTTGRHHHFVFSEQSRLAGTTITFPDPFLAALESGDKSGHRSSPHPEDSSVQPCELDSSTGFSHIG